MESLAPFYLFSLLSAVAVSEVGAGLVMPRSSESEGESFGFEKALEFQLWNFSLGKHLNLPRHPEACQAGTSLFQGLPENAQCTHGQLGSLQILPG